MPSTHASLQLRQEFTQDQELNADNTYNGIILDAKSILIDNETGNAVIDTSPWNCRSMKP
jgi:phosphatidylserine/phosphatidylglycerophosphate/cardiolipin synthase-like enzyme